MISSFSYLKVFFLSFAHFLKSWCKEKNVPIWPIQSLPSTVFEWIKSLELAISKVVAPTMQGTNHYPIMVTYQNITTNNIFTCTPPQWLVWPILRNASLRYRNLWEDTLSHTSITSLYSQYNSLYSRFHNVL